MELEVVSVQKYLEITKSRTKIIWIFCLSCV